MKSIDEYFLISGAFRPATTEQALATNITEQVQTQTAAQQTSEQTMDLGTAQSTAPELQDPTAQGQPEIGSSGMDPGYDF